MVKQWRRPGGIPEHIDRWYHLWANQNWQGSEILGYFAHDISRQVCRPVHEADVHYFEMHVSEQDDQWGNRLWCAWIEPDEERSRRWHTLIARCVAALHPDRFIAERWWWRYENTPNTEESQWARFAMEMRAFHDGQSALLDVPDVKYAMGLEDPRIMLPKYADL